MNEDEVRRLHEEALARNRSALETARKTLDELDKILQEFGGVGGPKAFLESDKCPEDLKEDAKQEEARFQQELDELDRQLSIEQDAKQGKAPKGTRRRNKPRI